MPSPGLFLTLLLTLQNPLSTPDPFVPDELLRRPGSPEVAIFRSVAPGSVSLRLSTSLPPSTRDTVGAIRIVQLAAHARMQILAERIGASASVGYTPHGLVYQVSGALVDLDFLGWILRQGVRPPTDAEFDATRTRLRVEVERLLDTPGGVLSIRLRDALAPNHPSVPHSVIELDSVEPDRIANLWERLHQPEEMRLTVAGRVVTEEVLALLADFDLPEDPVGPGGVGEPRVDQNPASPSPASTEVLRHWQADAYPLQVQSEAVALVVTRHIATAVEEADLSFEVGIELWDLRGARALVVIGAAYPEDVEAMRSRLGALIEEAIGALQPQAILRTSGALRAELLRDAQTPWGQVDAVGRRWDRGDGPDALSRLLIALDEVTVAQVGEVFEQLLATPPIRQEVTP